MTERFRRTGTSSPNTDQGWARVQAIVKPIIPARRSNTCEVRLSPSTLCSFNTRYIWGMMTRYAATTMMYPRQVETKEIIMVKLVTRHYQSILSQLVQEALFVTSFKSTGCLLCYVDGGVTLLLHLPDFEVSSSGQWCVTFSSEALKPTQSRRGDGVHSLLAAVPCTEHQQNRHRVRQQ